MIILLFEEKYHSPNFPSIYVPVNKLLQVVIYTIHPNNWTLIIAISHESKQTLLFPVYICSVSTLTEEGNILGKCNLVMYILGESGTNPSIVLDWNK